MAVIVDLSPVRVDLVVYVGDANVITFRLWEDDAKTIGLNLTDAVITAQARASALDPAVAVAAAVNPVDLPNGVFTIGFDGETLRGVLDALDAETWTGKWDLQILESGSTRPTTVFAGTITATYDMTRA